jgi:hypothetical protein
MGKSKAMNLCLTMLLSLSAANAPAFAAKTIYVDDDATGANTGSSWTDAYNFLQDALADANSSEKPVEILVAQGVYQPDRSVVEPNGTGDREATFQLINGVIVKGRYAGSDQPDPNARDSDLYKTILSGDLNGDDVIVDGNPRFRGENSYHVVTGSATDKTAVLSGFMVTGGNANRLYHRHGKGGGMFNGGYSNPTVEGCMFSDNMGKDGAGMYTAPD